MSLNKANAYQSLWFAVMASLASISPTYADDLHYSVSWLGNSFSGASNKWVQNFFIHTKVQPDGTVHAWSHWDEGGKKFGVYKDGKGVSPEWRLDKT